MHRADANGLYRRSQGRMVQQAGTGAPLCVLRIARCRRRWGGLPAGRREAIGSEDIASRRAKGCVRGLDRDGSPRAGEG
ncbi:MAG: hypothetical protein WAO08_31045, partial [Hyphomicrobiaceae bacterium]